jgi:protein SCO1/2
VLDEPVYSGENTLPKPTVAPAARIRTGRPYALVSGYVLLALGFFVAGFLLLPLLKDDNRPAVSLERIKLPRPEPVKDFSLDDVDENVSFGAYTRERLLNQWTLMYFGYTHCPDVCRPTLAVMVEVARRLRAAPHWSARLELVFVSVDPSRDTATVLRDYLRAADAGVVGLRGSEKQIANLAQQLGIMYLAGPADQHGDYLIDHPATILLIDPGAKLRAGFSLPRDATRVAELVSEIAQEFETGQEG